MELHLDAYAQAVEWLTENPGEIYMAWGTGGPDGGQPGSCLFAFATPTGKSFLKSNSFGCLTEIRSREFCAYTPEITSLIVHDERLPSKYRDITPEHLPVFAEWQRRLDLCYDRTPPPLDDRLPLPKGDIPIPEVVLEAAQ